MAGVARGATPGGEEAATVQAAAAAGSSEDGGSSRRPSGARATPVAVAHTCEDVRPLKWAKVVRRVARPPVIGSAAWVRGAVTGGEARDVRRAAEAASTGATRRTGGIGLALAARPPVTTTGGDAASRQALLLALNAAGPRAGVLGGEAGGARRREGRSASELSTGVATERVVAHVTQPSLWEPGVT